MILESLAIGLTTLVTGAAFYRYHLSKSWGQHDTTSEIEVKGKKVLITGGNSGLGKELALEIAKRGATVFIASSNITLSQKVAKEINDNIKAQNVIPVTLDLGSLESIKGFVQDFCSKHDDLFLLVNNAGVFCPLSKKLKTKDGFEMNFGVNHLGHFLLTNLLLQRKTCNPTRIVVVASSLSEGGEIDFNDIMSENKIENNPRKGYSNSKLANILFAKELSKRVTERNINVYALCPGWVKTDLARYLDLKWYNYLLMLPVALMFMRSTRHGVQTMLHCSLSKKLSQDTGKLYRNCDYWEIKNPQVTKENAKLLWEVSEKLVGSSFK